MDFAADLTLFYADFGVMAAHTPKAGGATTYAMVLHDQPGQMLIGGDILATDHTLRFPVADFPVVRKGEQFVVSEVTYHARENAQPLEDGMEYTVPLSKG